jgi:CDGSH-type Zn-finger protein
MRWNDAATRATYVRKEPMADTRTIDCRPNGPYLVDGPLAIKDPTGKVTEIPEGKKAALCRCGASTTKPFCDGTHSKIGFAAAEAAVAQGGG